MALSGAEPDMRIAPLLSRRDEPWGLAHVRKLETGGPAQVLAEGRSDADISHWNASLILCNKPL